MGIDSKALALLAAAIVGTGVVACQRAGENQSASNQENPSASSQGSSAPMNQAPRQGYTGPSISSPPADAASEEKSGQPADQTTNPADQSKNPMKQPGIMGQEYPQR